MPRIPRASVGGVCYHIINRGNSQRDVFLKDSDYEAFLKAMSHACIEVPMRVLAYCLMPNHFHLAVWPRGDGDLSTWMHWLQNTHVRRYHQHYHSTGHLWQGRFKAFPIQEDDHLLTVLRYVERNPLRAKLVRRAERWTWSSAHDWQAEEQPSWLDPGPVRRPRNWVEWVNQPLTPAELDAVHRSIVRGSPFGDPAWSATAAQQMGLVSTLRERGRPRKAVPASVGEVASPANTAHAPR
jgi:putative transposase